MFEFIHSSKSLDSTDSLVANQFCFVTLDSLGQLVLLTTAGGNAIGVLQDKPGPGDPGFICGPGDITKMQFGGTVVAGQAVSSNALGQAVAATTGTPYLGIALGAGAAGGIGNILFQPSGFMAP
jgi:hypothetical protein